jgi:pimeloyl-ACP methyl ester carboxylesterase
MRFASCCILALVGFGLRAQVADTFLLKYPVSYRDTVCYQRIIRFDNQKQLYQVRDYYVNGQIAMEARYSAFDRTVREGWQCNFRSNTKEGPYREWHENGQLRVEGRFRNGLANGRVRSWYANGTPEADEGRRNGQLHGRVRYYTPEGILERDLRFRNGNNRHPAEATYPYLPWLPKEYQSDTVKRWPLIIYLHGGSTRGTNLKRLYDAGIPDQLYRGREFPFIIISPLCPKHIRWSTDNWFGNFWSDITTRYRIDSTRVYVSGQSLGGSGSWYLAARYPDKIAAIAPISGFTNESDYLRRHLSDLFTIPVWAFHGMADDVVPFEESSGIINTIRDRGTEVLFTADSSAGHGLSWQVYPGRELYEWFLRHHK